MKVITLKQPYATLVAEGLKEYEFRTWKTKYRGEILIHAGKGIDKEAMKRYEHLGLNYPSGCIIARVNLTDCIKVDDDFRKELIDKNRIIYYNLVENPEWEGYGFKIENVKKIEPIYVNGKLSFWDYEI